MTTPMPCISDHPKRGFGADRPQATTYKADTQRGTTPEGSPIAVFSNYLILPGEIDLWTESWKRLARVAAAWAGCQSFRLIRDRNDETYVATYSEWDDMRSYNTFVRESRVMWLQRALGHVCASSGSRFLDVLSTESAKGAGG